MATAAVVSIRPGSVALASYVDNVCSCESSTYDLSIGVHLCVPPEESVIE